MKVKSESELTQLSDSLRPHGLQPTRLLYPWDFPGKNPGVSCLLRVLGPRNTNLYEASSLPESDIVNYKDPVRVIF